ncbi:hypothetical protein [Actinacidiphila sp. ITFR-21]|uniref:hypothetical protein n=1 Tax=Actinacidiphila sp. ITFR-21 TaxID=3075199 RepID=UPI00288A1260|nr:hypothetical protein [Streptomyces sp. ITFR-21]WNI16059.1 hypothetical protein RLT57_11320 [Streptomyces sp. ITFR-21]
MSGFFVCEYRGERLAGFDDVTDGDGEAPRLYAAGPRQVLAALADGTPGHEAAAERGWRSVRLPAGAGRELRMRPALFPEHPGDALVGGFMQTHNVKSGATSGGAPAAAGPGQPTWFFKGTGTSLRTTGDPLTVPATAVAVCEEAEVVLVHIDDEEGTPRYAGYTFGNDLTDIGLFRRHAGHLGYAKLCDAAVSPWFFPGPPPASVTGRVLVLRDGATAYQGGFTTGSDALAFTLDTMVGHLAGYPALHHPGRVHYTFLGADRSSFHHGFTITDGDTVVLDVTSHRVTLVNPVRWSPPAAAAAPASTAVPAAVPAAPPTAGAR